MDNCYTLDDNVSYEECAVLTFRTALHGYQLAAELNHCRDIELQRIDPQSMHLEDALPAGSDKPPLLPVYSYRNERTNLTYRLFDISHYEAMPEQLRAAMQWADKVLFIEGMDCYGEQRYLYGRLTTAQRPADPLDRLEHSIEARWRALEEQIIDLHYYDLSDLTHPRSSRWNDATFPLPPKVRRMIDLMEEFFANLMEMVAGCEYVNRTKNLQI